MFMVELRSYSKRTWETLFETEPQEKTARYWIEAVLEKRIARNKFWLYIIDALQKEQELHCQVRITGIESLPGIPAWLFIQGIERPWIIGSLENSLPLYGEHELEPGSLIRFRCENICRVLLTQDSA
jgi:hypothetical protein